MTGAPQSSTSTASTGATASGASARGSRMMARLITPFVAVVPWLITVGGLVLLGGWFRRYAVAMQPAWGSLIGGTVILLFAALVWAVLSAWSSTGTTIAGLCTIVVGLLLGVPRINREVISFLIDLFGSGNGAVLYVFTPVSFILLGALLVAAGLGAAGARRLGRPRA